MVAVATPFFPFGMYLCDRINPKIVLLIGGCFTLSAVLICSYIKDPIVFKYLYSVGLGIGKGFMYSSSLYCGISHLPGRKGVVSGCIISGFGFGGFIFGNISHHFANPDNIRVV